MPKRAWMSWSSGKDSAFALYEARRQGLEVVGLLTTVSATYDRVAMHGVRRELLDAQAQRLGLPLCVVELPSPCPNEVYEARMREAIERAQDDRVEVMIFGDLFLDDIRAYRERMLAHTSIEAAFPLWQRPTDALAVAMLDAGIYAVISCLDPRSMPRELAGAVWNRELIASLPEGVDPCGENGEFHTFVRNAPGFSSAIEIRVGQIVERDGFVFADILPA